MVTVLEASADPLMTGVLLFVLLPFAGLAITGVGDMVSTVKETKVPGPLSLSCGSRATARTVWLPSEREDDWFTIQFPDAPDVVEAKGAPSTQMDTFVVEVVVPVYAGEVLLIIEWFAGVAMVTGMYSLASMFCGYSENNSNRQSNKLFIRFAFINGSSFVLKPIHTTMSNVT